MQSYEGVLLASVPEHESDLATSILPGASLDARPLDDIPPDDHPGASLIAVMIQDRPTGALLQQYPQLQALVTRSDGFDHLPLQWCRKNGVVVCNLHDYATSSVAHMAVSFITALIRRFPEAMAETQGSFRGGTDPPGWRRGHLVGRHLQDVTVGIVGTGAIGSEVVRILDAMGGNCIGYDIEPRPELQSRHRLQYVEDLASLLELSDVLSLHVPLTDQTRAMIDKDALSRLPEGACVVNTCRGGVVDQAAVEDALRQGRLAGYAADALPGEPDPGDLGRFHDLPNVLLTPHLGAQNRHTLRARYVTTAKIATALLSGDQDALLPYVVS